jgi:hypothetical protein
MCQLTSENQNLNIALQSLWKEPDVLISRTVLTFAWTKWRNPQKTFTWYIQNIKQECYLLVRKKHQCWWLLLQNLWWRNALTCITVNFMHIIMVTKEKREVCINKTSSLQHCILHFTTRQSFVLISIVTSRSLFHKSGKWSRRYEILVWSLLNVMSEVN